MVPFVKLSALLTVAEAVLVLEKGVAVLEVVSGACVVTEAISATI